jgi:phage portal protein BeeE
VPNLSFDGVIGMSPLTYAAETIRLGLSYEKYGVKFYQNAAMPSGVFESPNP